MSEELRSIPPQHGSFVFTSESVTEGHPDKIADQISDAVLDAILAKEIELQEQGYIAPNGVPANVENVRCACETLVTTGTVIVAGEIRTQARRGDGGRGEAHERDGDLDGGQQLVGIGGELDGALGALIALLGIVLQHGALSRGESHLGHGEVAVDKRQNERGNKGDGYVHREFLEPPRFGTSGQNVDDGYGNCTGAQTRTRARRRGR